MPSSYEGSQCSRIHLIKCHSLSIASLSIHRKRDGDKYNYTYYIRHPAMNYSIYIPIRLARIFDIRIEDITRTAQLGNIARRTSGSVQFCICNIEVGIIVKNFGSIIVAIDLRLRHAHA